MYLYTVLMNDGFILYVYVFCVLSMITSEAPEALLVVLFPPFFLV